jgi:hypothetical protein
MYSDPKPDGRFLRPQVGYPEATAEGALREESHMVARLNGLEDGYVNSYVKPPNPRPLVRLTRPKSGGPTWVAPATVGLIAASRRSAPFSREPVS